MIKASADLRDGVLGTTGTEDVRLLDFAIDGSRTQNPRLYSCIDVANARDVVIDRLRISDCGLHGVSLEGTTSDVVVSRSEIFRHGASPAPAQHGAGISVGGSSWTVAHITIGPHNRVHDNNIGIQVVNSSCRMCDTAEVNIFSNFIYQNANDGIMATAFQNPGSRIVGLRAADNEIYCNGWPADGIGFSSRCAAGFQQRGSTSSQGGVAIDLIQNGDGLVVRPSVIGNRMHDNVFEAVATSTNLFCQVDTNGKSVRWVSGSSQFNPQWKSGQVVTLNQTPYLIESVESLTQLTLSSSAGDRKAVGFAGPSFMSAVISDNFSHRNGNATMKVGPGFYNQFSDGTAYTRNEATDSNFEGFENYFGNFVSYTGDKAFSNNRSQARNRDHGFANHGGIGNSYIDVVADDVSKVPTQRIALSIGNAATNTIVRSDRLRGSKGAISNCGAGSLIAANGSRGRSTCQR